jgi:hypothetical protein
MLDPSELDLVIMSNSRHLGLVVMSDSRVVSLGPNMAANPCPGLAPNMQTQGSWA